MHVIGSDPTSVGPNVSLFPQSEHDTLEIEPCQIALLA